MFCHKNSNQQPSKGFCEEISILIISANELKIESTIFNQSTNEIVSNLNTFSLGVLDKIFRDVNGIGIGTIYGEMFLTNIIIKKKFLHLKELSAIATYSNVLCLGSGERYRILLFTYPKDKIILQLKTPTRCAITIISITSPVSIRIPSQHIINVLIIPNTKITS